MAAPVETILRLHGSRAFAKSADQAAKSIGGVGQASDDAGEKSRAGWKDVAKWAGASAAVYAAARYLRSAVSSTEDLAKNTMALERATGMDTKTASAWAELLKVRGIDVGKFQVGIVKLSKTMEAARTGNAKAAATLQQLGVSHDAIQTGDVDRVVMQSADAFAAMTNPAEKAALAATAFGKSGVALLPMLSGGSSALAEQIGMVDRYGATINDTAGAKDMIAQQREMTIAMDGLKVRIGTAVLPALQTFAGVLLRVVQAVSPVLRNSTAFRVVLGVLAAAFVAVKVQAMGAAFAFIRSNFALFAVVLAVVAVVAGVTALYTKWRWFHNAVDGTLSWVTGHWQLLAALLLGPIVPAVVFMVGHFGRVKSAATGAWDSIKTMAGRIGGFMADAFTVDAGAMTRGLAGWINAHTLFGDTVVAGPVRFRLPALAAGGHVRVAGMALVGEEGPEVVTTTARFPTPAVQPVPQPRVQALRERYGRPHTTVQEVHLTRRQLAEATGSHTADRIARR
jgi:hypothetical protein